MAGDGGLSKGRATVPVMPRATAGRSKGSMVNLKSLLRSSRALAMLAVVATWPYLYSMMTGMGFFSSSPSLKGSAGAGGMRGGGGAAHVRVIVRVHKQQDFLLRSLVWAIRAQTTEQVKADFLLVPTEARSVAFFQQLARELNGHVRESDVHVLELPDPFFSDARLANPYTCPPAVRQAYVKEHGEGDTHRICDFDHYVYYRATDQGLIESVTHCPHCTHFVITNGDNLYAPGFLRATLGAGRDLVATGFCHAGMAFEARMELGHIDLGAVLVRRSVLRGGDKTFLSSLPAGAGAKHVHDADFYFFREGVERGASVAILPEIAFYHH